MSYDFCEHGKDPYNGSRCEECFKGYEKVFVEVKEMKIKKRKHRELLKRKFIKGGLR